MEPAFCFESRNGSCMKTIYPLPMRISLYVFLGVAIILTVCGNFLVTVFITYFKQLHTPTNFLIVSLAVCDLLVGVFVMFPSMIQSVETCWYFGDEFCKIYMSSDVTLCTASILNLSFISLDRHYAVCQPLLYRRKITVNVVFIMILISWGVSALIGFGMIFLKLNIRGIEDFFYNHIACVGNCILFQSSTSSAVSTSLSFYIPGFIMLCIYLKILLVAKRQLRSIQNTNYMKHQNAKTSNTSHTKATKTLAIIMGVFLFFWAPFFVINTMDPFIDYSTPIILFETFVWVGYLNSMLNPLIYAFYYSWFRKAFRLFASGEIFRSDLSETRLLTE